MSVSLAEVGISEIEDFALLNQSEVEKVVEVSDEIVKFDGTLDTTAGHTFDPSFTFSFRGKGSLPAGLALASDGNFDHAQISDGRTLVHRIKSGEYSDKHNDWEASGLNCPEAALPE